MTKLTQQEIKKEQVKFREWFHTKWADELQDNGLYNTKRDHILRTTKKGLFVDKHVKKMFRSWLKIVEVEKEHKNVNITRIDS